MRVADMMQPDGRVFLKSEWGPLSDYWPAVSFTKPSVGMQLSRDFKPGRDILIYVGTSGGLTEDPDHRSRLISAVVPEPNRIHETQKIIPPTSWAWSMQNNGVRWPHSFAIVKGADMVGPPYPSAYDVIPAAYSSFARIENRGSFIEALGSERVAVMALDVVPLTLNLAPAVVAYFRTRASTSVPKSVAQEVHRMATLITERVKAGGETSVRINPLRSAPIFSDLTILLTHLWQTKQSGRCALCSAEIHADTKNSMMKVSADRIDSSNGAYDESNVQITHLGCNLAKNQWGADDFDEWVAALRGVDVLAEP